MNILNSTLNKKELVINFVRTDSSNPDFKSLVHHLDRELWERYGEEQSFFDRFNGLDHIRHVIVAYSNDRAFGCGAIKEYSPVVAEVKRMYVSADVRGKGIAASILASLEQWAAELGYNECILETGIAQPEAIHLYGKSGYEVIPNYGQYAGVKSSVCMRKGLNG